MLSERDQRLGADHFPASKRGLGIPGPMGGYLLTAIKPTRKEGRATYMLDSSA